MMIIPSMVMVSSIFLTLSMVTPTYQQLPQQLQGYRMEQAIQVQSSAYAYKQFLGEIVENKLGLSCAKLRSS